MCVHSSAGACTKTTGKPGLPPVLDREREEMVEGTAKQAQASVCVAGAEE